MIKSRILSWMKRVTHGEESGKTRKTVL